MKTRAKFYISGLTLLPGATGAIQVALQAVSRGDRNASWATATPSGSLTMTINNPAAAQWWDDFMRAARATGKQPEMFIDIEPATDGWPGDGHAYRPSAVTEGNYGHGTCGECGTSLDAKLWEWDKDKGRSVESENLAHPNG